MAQLTIPLDLLLIFVIQGCYIFNFFAYHKTQLFEI